MQNLHSLLQPYIPTSSDPFDAVKAAHLLNRAGFGGTPEEIEQVRKLGPAEAVEYLLDFPDAPAEEQEEDTRPDFDSIANLPTSARQYRRSLIGKTPEERRELQAQFAQANYQALRALQNWWLQRMVSGRYPLQEKLTLFWHGHFTTSAKDERSALLMWRQNETLRRYAAGNFEPFLHAISRDPAMLDYLNNSQNHKQHPNENYAREVMELFTLGIGNYTETDVKQGARAFTGWEHDGDEFIFRRNFHDYGEKTFLGQTGNFDGDDVLSIILEQQACPRFVGGELFKWFAYENSDTSLANGIASVLWQNKYALRPFLRTILTSRAFYSPQAIGAQIKCPVQLVVGTIRLLGVPMPRGGAVESALNQMGQLPLMPPNVRGWPGGRMWINTSTLFVRYNTGVWLAGGDVPAFSRVNRKGENANKLYAARTSFDPMSAGTSAMQVVDEWVSRLIQRPIDQDKKQTLAAALGDNPTNAESLRKMVQLIVSMPEYQLC